MLHHLARYAQQRDLAPEPGFATRKAHWAVHIDDQGQLLRLEHLETAGRPKAYPRSPQLSQPELLGGGESAPRSHFLLESARVLLDHRDANDRHPHRAELKRQHFQSMLRQCLTAQPELQWLQAINLFLDSPAQRDLAKGQITDRRGSPGDELLIIVQGRNPLESSLWHDWWRDYRTTLTSRSPRQASPALDLMTGQLTLPLSTHRRIRGLQHVGGHAIGDALISFGQPAFASYGFQRAHNAPLSADSEAAYVLALNHLLSHAPSVGGLMLCAWTDPPAGDPLSSLFGEGEGKGQVEGERLEEETRFHLLMLSANYGRVMVRDHLEGRCQDLQQALEAWSEDLSLVEAGAGIARQPSLREIFLTLQPQPGELPATLAADIVRSAVTSAPLPQTLLPLLLERIATDITKSDRDAFPTARIALLKAILLRSHLSAPRRLKKDHPSPAYHCGRLLAMLAKRIRHRGVTTVQRSYRAVCYAPAVTVPRLLEEAWMRGHSPQRSFLRRLSNLPHRFDLEQQGLLALGYHGQKVHYEGVTDAQPG